MHITIYYAAQAKQVAGRACEDIELPLPCAVRDLLRHLARKHGEALGRLLLNEDGEPQPALLLFAGDEQVPLHGARDLQPGDTLTILPPIAGG